MQIIVRSEADAWRLLQDAVSKSNSRFEALNEIKFSGWPKLDIYLGIEKPLLTPTMMRALVDFQDGIWRSYALIKKREANIALLTDDERAELELGVEVKDGSLELAAKAWEKCKPFVDEALKKMDGRHVVICVLGFTVCFYGADVWRADFQHRLELRKAELASTQKLEELKATQFIAEQETKRMQILDEAYKQALVLKEVAEQAEAARVAVLKSVPSHAEVKLQGTRITGSLANDLAKNPREIGHDERLRSTYSVLRVDARNPEGFQVMVRDIAHGYVFSALLKDAASIDLRKVIERATFEKKPIKATIDVNRKKGRIVAAWIMAAELDADGWKTTTRRPTDKKDK